MGGLPAELALPERRASRRQFERRAATFGAASFIHDEARARLFERLDLVRIGAGALVDLGAGQAAGARELARRFPTATVVAIDSSLAMLAAGRRTGFSTVVGDAERLPLADRSVGLALANMLLPWCDPATFFGESARVLKPDGVLLFSTLGPDTLVEIRRAFGRADDAIHVHGFIDMHDLGDLALRAGLEEPVLDVERVEVTYADVASLVGDLKRCGGTNVAAGRRRSLTGVGRWKAFERHLAEARSGGRIAVTIELILGQAFGRSVPGHRSAAGGEVHVPIAEIGGRH